MSARPLTDEELDALAERLFLAWKVHPFRGKWAFKAAACEAARWAEEQEGEVVWQAQAATGWYGVSAELAAHLESQGAPVRAIRVIATTTKGQTE